jgi:hypothetical protein
VMTGSRGWICPVVADPARLIIFLDLAGLVRHRNAAIR